jgi:hypothetical protein
LIDALLPDSQEDSKLQDELGPAIWEQQLSTGSNIEHVITQYYAAEQIMETVISNSELVLKPATGKEANRSQLSETPSQMSIVQMKEEDLDSMAKLILHDLEPVKRLIADTVTGMIQMIQNARRSNQQANEELY